MCNMDNYEMCPHCIEYKEFEEYILARNMYYCELKISHKQVFIFSNDEENHQFLRELQNIFSDGVYWCFHFSWHVVPRIMTGAISAACTLSFKSEDDDTSKFIQLIILRNEGNISSAKFFATNYSGVLDHS